MPFAAFGSSALFAAASSIALVSFHFLHCCWLAVSCLAARRRTAAARNSVLRHLLAPSGRARQPGNRDVSSIYGTQKRATTSSPLGSSSNTA